MPKVDFTKVRNIPILQVAQALGMDIVKEGTAWAMREDGSREVTSLTLFPDNNRWKRWSGIEYGGVSSGSVIDLVMHIQNVDMKKAVSWLTQHFPSFR